MSQIERYRELYEWEIDSNKKMLRMLASVPEARRSDPLFNRALCITVHLAACRENWLSFMLGKSANAVDWFVESATYELLQPRYESLEKDWTAFLSEIDDIRLANDFSFVDGGETWAVNLGVQVEQLIGHASYHRGQVALIVDLLGGEVVDTDYVEWALAQG